MSYRVHKYQEPTEHKIVKGILKGLWWLVSAPFKLIFSAQGRSAFGGKKRNPGQMQTPENVSLDRQYAANKWQEIEQLLQLGHPSNYQRAILEADKLLDHLLKGHRAPGLTMGDRLKASQNKFSKEGYNAAWQAHKVRNEIVHNTDYPVTDFIARQAIENFKKAITELISV